MDCLFTSRNKRRPEGGELEKWESCGPSKKLCSGLGVAHKVECATMVDSPMTSWEMGGERGDSAIRSNTVSNAVYTLQSGISGQCLRCMAGESGHINHILGY